ncbi:MAG: hypothetical protein MHPSP_001215 [Paramarteilia canceri]
MSRIYSSDKSSDSIEPRILIHDGAEILVRKRCDQFTGIFHFEKEPVLEEKCYEDQIIDYLLDYGNDF